MCCERRLFVRACDCFCLGTAMRRASLAGERSGYARREAELPVGTAARMAAQRSGYARPEAELPVGTAARMAAQYHCSSPIWRRIDTESE